MERFFNSNNPVMKALSKIFDIAWLSILYVVFSLPVITFGASTTALYYVSAKVLRRDRGYVWHEFWHSFKLNFIPATITWIIFAVMYFLLGANLYIMTKSGPTEYGGYLVGVYIALFVLVTCVVSHAFCVLSRFDMKIAGLLRFYLFVSFRHFHYTLVNLAIIALAVFIIYKAMFLGPIVIFIVPGGASLLYTFMEERLLKKYMPKEETKVTEDGEEIKNWYNE